MPISARGNGCAFSLFFCLLVFDRFGLGLHHFVLLLAIFGLAFDILIGDNGVERVLDFTANILT